MFSCILCKRELKNKAHFGIKKLKRVTSDCRLWTKGGEVLVCDNCGMIQRLRDDLLRNECNTIYSKYRAHRQGKGAEQSVCKADSFGNSRSNEILCNLFDYLELSDNKKIKWLDYGCGEGHFLKEVSFFYKNIQLSGYDVHSRKLELLNSIPNYKNYYSSTKHIEEKYEVVSLVHVIEHLFDLRKELMKICNLLNNGGYIFIQIPNIFDNPFDLVVADHVSFFSKVTVSKILNYCGLVISVISDNWVAGEISVLAQKKKNNYRIVNADSNIQKKLVDSHYNFLTEILMEIEGKLNLYNKINIFGTSIGATWVANEIGLKKVSTFVDEDRNRINFKHLGKKIKSPSGINFKQTIFPLKPKTHAIIQKKYIN